jgi:hypothetical protein
MMTSLVSAEYADPPSEAGFAFMGLSLAVLREMTCRIAHAAQAWCKNSRVATAKVRIVTLA